MTVPDPLARRPRPARMLFIMAAWGGCFVAISWGLDRAPPLWFAMLRSAVAGVALVGFAVVQRRPRPQGPRFWWLVSGLALTNAAVAFGAMFASVAELATGIAAVLANTQPLLIVLPAWWLYGERVRPMALVALAVGFGGLVLVGAASGSGRGAGLSILAAVAITAGTLWSRRLAGTDIVWSTAMHFIEGAVMLSLVALALEGTPTISWTPGFVGIVLALGSFGTAIPFVLWFQETLRAPLAAVSAWTFLVPVFAVVLGAALQGERPSGQVAAGLALVLVSLGFVLRRR